VQRNRAHEISVGGSGLSEPRLYPLTVGLTQWSRQAQGVAAEPIYNLVITGSLLMIVPLVSRRAG
jgi:multiple sugar transport system permease protein